ncbi:MAG: glycosyltransferase family 4 protein [Pseudomonadota bacterium]
MHILFLTDNFPPETNAPASRTFDHAKAWVAEGHEVTVVTCAPNFPKGKVFDGYRNRLWQSEMMDGIRVIRLWTYITANDGFVRRILDYQSFMVTGFFASLFVRRADVVVGTSPQFFTACAAWASAALKRRPFVFELRDLWPESIRAVGAMKQSRVLDVFERLEMFLYRRAHAIVSVTQSFKQNLIDRCIDGEKIHVVTNGVDASRFSPMPKDGALTDALGLGGKFVAGYIGTHGMAHSLETVVDAAAILTRDETTRDIRILFLGDGARRRAVMEKADALGLNNVLFLQSVPKADVPRYWSLLDVAVIHLRKTDLFKTVIPSKMFECFGMGLPILHGVEGESADILNSVGAGMTFEPENAEDLAAKIKHLKDNPDQMNAYAERGQQGAASYDRQTLAKAMLRVLEHVAKR